MYSMLYGMLLGQYKFPFKDPMNFIYLLLYVQFGQV